MPDKDQFTFDDDDGFPETNLDGQKNSPASDLADDFSDNNLSAAFSDGEYEAETPVQEESEPKVKSGGGSTMRIALMVLLLVVAGVGGAYYFMELGGTTPSVPTVQVPVQKVKKSVALPSPPAKAPVAPGPVSPAKAPVSPIQAEEASKPVTVAVPPSSPPAEPVSEAAAKPQSVPVPQPAKKEVAENPKPAKQTTTQVVVPAASTPKAEPVPQKTAVEVPSSSKPATSPKQVTDGAYALDAGSYLLELNRKTLATKIKKLGYEPIITPVDATLNMTRLRLGTFGKDEVQEALAFARTIEPGSYSAPAGDQYVIYAGTFLNSRNIENLTKRLLAEGIRVYPEPVQVVRTLSRVRFGSFATKEDAAAAAREVSESGVKAVVVKSK
jgi:cell division septation protein DedD